MRKRIRELKPQNRYVNNSRDKKRSKIKTRSVMIDGGFLEDLYNV